MTTVQLTPDPTRAAVVLLIRGAPAGTVTINRVDANGSRPVRQMPGQKVIAGAVAVVDYEPALAGRPPVTLPAAYPGGGVYPGQVIPADPWGPQPKPLIRYDVLTSDGKRTSATTSLVGVDFPQLQVAQVPQLRRALQSVTGYSAERATTTTVHQVIGRVDPVVTIGKMRLRTGTLTAWCADHAAAQAVEALAGRGQLLLLRQPTHAGLDLYFSATRTSVTPDSNATERRRWTVSLDYVETAPPRGDLMGSLGWDFDTVADAGSFAALVATYDTFTDLTVGPTL